MKCYPIRSWKQIKRFYLSRNQYHIRINRCNMLKSLKYFLWQPLFCHNGQPSRDLRMRGCRICDSLNESFWMACLCVCLWLTTFVCIDMYTPVLFAFTCVSELLIEFLINRLTTHRYMCEVRWSLSLLVIDESFVNLSFMSFLVYDGSRWTAPDSCLSIHCLRFSTSHDCSQFWWHCRKVGASVLIQSVYCNRKLPFLT